MSYWLNITTNTPTSMISAFILNDFSDCSNFILEKISICGTFASWVSNCAVPLLLFVSQRNMRNRKCFHLAHIITANCIINNETTSKGSWVLGLKTLMGQTSMYLTCLLLWIYNIVRDKSSFINFNGKIKFEKTYFDIKLLSNRWKCLQMHKFFFMRNMSLIISTYSVTSICLSSPSRRMGKSLISPLLKPSVL